MMRTTKNNYLIITAICFLLASCHSANVFYWRGHHEDFITMESKDDFVYAYLGCMEHYTPKPDSIPFTNYMYYLDSTKIEPVVIYERHPNVADRNILTRKAIKEHCEKSDSSAVQYYLYGAESGSISPSDYIKFKIDTSFILAGELQDCYKVLLYRKKDHYSLSLDLEDSPFGYMLLRKVDLRPLRICYFNNNGFCEDVIRMSKYKYFGRFDSIDFANKMMSEQILEDLKFQFQMSLWSD